MTYKRRQFRPLAYYGPDRGQVTLLVGAEEKGDDFEPKNACKIARNRIKDIESGRATVTEHRYQSE